MKKVRGKYANRKFQRLHRNISRAVYSLSNDIPIDDEMFKTVGVKGVGSFQIVNMTTKNFQWHELKFQDLLKDIDELIINHPENRSR